MEPASLIFQVFSISQVNQNQFVMHREVQAKKTGIGGARGDCYWEWLLLFTWMLV